MPKYNCERCGKEFKQKCDYNDHIKRKIPCKILTQKPSEIPQKTSGIVKKDIVCNYCGKEFSRKDNLMRHINGYCKIKKANDARLETIMEKLIKLEEDNKKNTNEIERLKVENAQYKQIINNTQNVKIDTQNNVIFNLVAYGQEDTSKITNGEFKRILNRGYNSVRHC